MGWHPISVEYSDLATGADRPVKLKEYKKILYYITHNQCIIIIIIIIIIIKMA
jgi:hypothetical protein